MEINTIRKHLSAVKGGQLARAAAPARVASLTLSDVIGDRLDSIGSGPTAADDTTYADCASIVRRYHLAGRLPPAVKERLDRGVAGEIAETPKSTDGLFARVHNVIVGNNKAAVDAAAAAANRLGYSATVLTMSLAAEAREAGASSRDRLSRCNANTAARGGGCV